MTDIVVGKTYTAQNQGTAITPRAIDVTVVWIDGQDVHYRIAGNTKAKQTSIDRFREIVGLPVGSSGEDGQA